ncbi:MAG: GAF domain-containing protein, partial [Betaproteobacteria bacterium]
MSSTPVKSFSGSEVTRRLAFFKELQAITTRIHAAKDIDEIILELSGELCALFEAERLSIYAVEEGGASIVTLVKTGLNAVQSIRLPVAENSIAGFVALSGRTVNVGDAYDEAELHAISPHLALRREVDASTGFRSHQMLVAPVCDPDGGRVLGVVQLINSRAGVRFSSVAEEGLLGLTQTLGVAFARHRKSAAQLRSRFDALVADGRITADELAAITRMGREEGVGTESLLIERLGLLPRELGEAASRFFGVPYTPYNPNQVKPMDLLRN